MVAEELLDHTDELLDQDRVLIVESQEVAEIWYVVRLCLHLKSGQRAVKFVIWN